jgi:hypothetical protein
MYNKVNVYKYRQEHPTEYKEASTKAAMKWRAANMDKVREIDRIRKSPFANEWRSFRRIDLF